MEIIQVVAAGIIGTVLSIAIKKQSPEISLLIGICTGVLIFIFVAGKLQTVLEVLKTMAERANISPKYMGIVLKVIGISYICEFGMQICKDAGESAIAGKIELAGKIIIMLVSAPVILAVVELILNMAK